MDIPWFVDSLNTCDLNQVLDFRLQEALQTLAKAAYPWQIPMLKIGPDHKTVPHPHGLKLLENQIMYATFEQKNLWDITIHHATFACVS